MVQANWLLKTCPSDGQQLESLDGCVRVRGSVTRVSEFMAQLIELPKPVLLINPV